MCVNLRRLKPTIAASGAFLVAEVVRLQSPVQRLNSREFSYTHTLGATTFDRSIMPTRQRVRKGGTLIA